MVSPHLIPSGQNVTEWNWWLDFRASSHESTTVTWLFFNVRPCFLKGSSNCETESWFEVYSHLFKARRKVLQSFSPQTGTALLLFIYYLPLVALKFMFISPFSHPASTVTFHICVLLPWWKSRAWLDFRGCFAGCYSASPLFYPQSLRQPSTTHLGCRFIPLLSFCSVPFELFKSGFRAQLNPTLFLRDRKKKGSQK